ncbi:hypothetical protein [Microbacterium telephonicum]|uniref:Uncharacterized protein n=1 Tax=Microbacterium telephonicum TaxID=1714841 RepID=A0A498CBL9_9MICO|nr:hypothetical protein [Microbacterium telephonicum]RLK52519.1 hypothetical protein C7474_0464 [Microbacterium telephonicum]
MTNDPNAAVVGGIAREVASGPRRGPNPGLDPTQYASRVVDWQTLTDDRAPIEWAALFAFTEWFVFSFDIPTSVVPNCWWQHRPLVEELSALRAARLLYLDPSNHGEGPSTFLQLVANAMPRITRVGGGCTREHHAPTPRYLRDGTDMDKWTAWVTQSHAHPGAAPVAPDERK